MLELIFLFAVCVLLGLGCLAAAGWVVYTPEQVGVEEIFLFIVGVLLAFVFFGMGAWIARNTRLRELGRTSLEEEPSGPAKAAPPKQEEPAHEEAGKPAS